MSVPASLKLLMSIGVAFQLISAANAADNTTDSQSPPVNDATACIDLRTDCSTLMVNYSSDSVKFSLLRRKSLKETPHSALLSDNNPADGQLLAIEFLRGFENTGDPRDITDEFTGKLVGSAEFGAIHDWAVAAAASMDGNFQSSDPKGAAIGSDLREDSQIFWDFDYVYQWEVDENILDGGLSDLAQVVLSEIYLPPKINSTSDPEIVVCELNDSSNCQPLSD